MRDDDLRKHSLALRYRTQCGEPARRFLDEAFALVREAGRRCLSMRHYDVQVMGGLAMFSGSVAEMQTGEGKTLTATLPMYVAALAGKGAHLATANDYLARRDAEWMRPIYELLGLTVGVVEADSSRDARCAAYQCDLTYGTAKEFGFDFLRDRLALRQVDEGSPRQLAAMLGQVEETGGNVVHREPHFALIDEADSILIDEARTPLIISATPDEDRRSKVELYRWAADISKLLEEGAHFERDVDSRAYTLTADGRRRVRELPRANELSAVPWTDIYTAVERAIRVARDFLCDREYIVRDGEIVIVDEYTGRLGEGRKWRDGLHQAIEAKEGVEVSVETGHAARITIQDYFLRYRHLAGMTGTASSSARELSKIYGMPVAKVPTNRPPVRKQLKAQFFGESVAKWQAVVQEIADVRGSGRPVLIGTRSIDKSELLSALLAEANIPHDVLNAHQVAREAEIVAAAGEPGRVTVATNMAGRGTDIQLSEEAEIRGGLHVILTELHDSARIDRQLIGRCGRQGDPGTYRQFFALDDDVLTSGLGTEKARVFAERGKTINGRAGDCRGWFQKAQRLVERRHFRQRRDLLRFEREREKMQRQLGLDPHLDAPE